MKGNTRSIGKGSYRTCRADSSKFTGLGFSLGFRVKASSRLLGLWLTPGPQSSLNNDPKSLNTAAKAFI